MRIDFAVVLSIAKLASAATAPPIIMPIPRWFHVLPCSRSASVSESAWSSPAILKKSSSASCWAPCTGYQIFIVCTCVLSAYTAPVPIVWPSASLYSVSATFSFWVVVQTLTSSTTLSCSPVATTPLLGALDAGSRQPVGINRASTAIRVMTKLLVVGSPGPDGAGAKTVSPAHVGRRGPSRRARSPRVLPRPGRPRLAGRLHHRRRDEHAIARAPAVADRRRRRDHDALRATRSAGSAP